MQHLTTDPRAARHYLAAADAASVGCDPMPHLVAAIDVDPSFAVAVIDFAVLTRASLPSVARPQTRWEREHLDIVRALAAGHLARACGLLDEHLADGGSDPMAMLLARRCAGSLRLSGPS